MARSSTTFKEGNQVSKGKGRKGYEYEQGQLDEMRKILNRALVMCGRIQLGEAGIKEAMAYENSIRMVLKIMDKLHPNKQEIKAELSGDLPFQIIEINKIPKDGGK